MCDYYNLHGAKPENCHIYIVPVRYPESDSLQYIDLVQFYLDKPVSYLTLIAQVEDAYMDAFYEKNVSRLSAGETAFDTIAKQYNGAWEYLKTDAHCAELK